MAERVAAGGHDIPEPVIRRRYQSAFENIAIALAEATVVFDNSHVDGPREILRIVRGKPVASTLDAALSSHARIATALRRGTGTFEEAFAP